MQESKAKNPDRMRHDCFYSTFYLDVRTRFLGLGFAFYLGCALLVAGGCQFVRDDNLNQAIARGEIKVVRKVIARGADVNGRGMHAITPLMEAAKAGQLDICELLVKQGADVNAHNDSGSVLMWGVSSGKEEVVVFLLNSGADRSWTNAIGQTAEAVASRRGLVKIASILKTNNVIKGVRP